jgi:hypothetical protein
MARCARQPFRAQKADGDSRRGVEHGNGGVVHRVSKGGFRRLAVVVAVAAAGILVVGAQAASAGTYEICKSGANGMAGKTFHFDVQPSVGGVPVGTSVGHNITPAGAGYTCTAPQNLAAASQAIVTESDVSTTSEVASITVIPISRKVGSENLAAKQVTVNLGTSTANETQIRYINQPAGGTSGILKVCKLSETPAYIGRSFSFRVNNGAAQSTIANDPNSDPAFWSCRILGTFQVNSVVRVTELIPSGSEVRYIDTDPGIALGDFNTNDCTIPPTPTALTCGEAFVRIQAGTTVVLYDNEPIPPSGTGFIEICKNPPGHQDSAVTGLWHFTITDDTGTPVGPVGGVDVGTGQCTTSLVVPAGILTVTETPRAGYQLTDVFTSPTDALVNSNLLNGTADVEVATTSDPTLETQVNFVNEAVRTQLKICKALGPFSGVLGGQTFYFNVTDITDPDNPLYLGSTSVTLGPTGATQCVPFRTLPIGTVVRVDEVFGADNPNTPYDESGEFITSTSPATTTIGAGTANTVTITNTAFGLLEVCKDPVAGLGVPKTFQFRIDSGAVFNVPAGGCANARRVSIGNHTVTEIAQADYELTGVTSDPAGRIVGTPDLANRNVIVSVPYGPDGETVVTFTNRIKQGRFKVCKAIPGTSFDSLKGKSFNFLLYIQTGGTHAAPTFTSTAVTVAASTDPLNLTTCSGFTAFYPILQANGERTIAAVQEQLGAGFAVDSITVSPNNGLCTFGTGLPPGGNTSPNCVPGGIDKTGVVTAGYAEIDWFLSGGSLGNAQVTFTNRAT